MRFSILLLLAAAIAGIAPLTAHTQKSHQRPNIILIVADDLGYGDLGCYGQQQIKTPHLDAMARGGMRFTRFYTGTSVCAPSRASLMTGLHTGHTAIRGNKSVKPEGQWPLPEGTLTMASLLKKAGYVTGDFGKWGLGGPGSAGEPLKQGFDRFYGYNCQSEAHNYYPDHLWDNEHRVEFSGNAYGDAGTYAGDLIHRNALQFIDENKGRPFFLFLSYTLPHAALQVPQDSTFEAYKKQFNEQPVAIPPTWDGKGYQPQAYPKAAYASMVSRLDRYVGEVLLQLKQKGLDKNTLVIFASDNGPHKEGGNDPSAFNSNGGLRGIKRDLYEGGIRTPFIAWWPGAVQAGKVSNYTGACWDLLPTFADMAKQPVVKHIDGVSILPVLLSKKMNRGHDYLYWEFHEQGGKQAVLWGNWKGVKLQAKQNPNAPIELYDLQKDPAETNNVAAQNPAVVQKIKKMMQEAHVENKDFPFFGGADKGGD
jgi:arylsulfatase A